MRSRLSQMAVVLAACLLLPSSFCRRASAVSEQAPEIEAQDLLVQYLRIDTTNPPGNEAEGARFLQRTLGKEGIEAVLVGSDPRRQGVYARLKSGSTAPALLLLHHIDVVPANAATWSVAPFSGQRSAGYIWGRGALDIKSLGIAELMAVLDLKRRRVALSRDVIFLACGDEERGGEAGIKALLKDNPALFENVGFVLNEGGANETIVDRVSFFGIQIDEKVPLWVKISTRGMAGHSALPPDDGGAIGNLLLSIRQVMEIPRPYRVTPSVRQYFAALAPAKPGEKGRLLANIDASLQSPRFESVLSASYRSLLRDTVAVTEIHGGDSANSLPSTAWASLDFRLLPDTSVDGTIAEIRKRLAPHSELDILLRSDPAPPSPKDSPLYKVLQNRMHASDPGSLVGPIVSAGTSDNRYFRQRGVIAYGFSPFKVNYYDADSVHGVDERIRARFFDQGVRLTRKIVTDFCAAADR
ncbi:MAG TPA: M20/M25/M40 family metallo-hydrolase [Thermoanaerobaculia bacterium]|nr:M20/M25/M40 family metallo-hydrolase [Thermoanaerobaculia bacterium]